MIELFILAMGVAATFSTYLLLLLIDVIVHQHLYRYGLQFSPSWADPYWTYLRISLTLLVVATIVILVLAGIVRLQKAKLKTGIDELLQLQKKLRGTELFIAVIGVASVFSAYALLLSIDKIIHETLYQYGLQFSYDWANFYWMCMRASLTLLGATAIMIAFLTGIIRRQRIKPLIEVKEKPVQLPKIKIEEEPQRIKPKMKVKEELSDHELMMRILNASKGDSMKLDDVRDLLPTVTKSKYVFWKTTIKPPRRYVHKRIKKLVKMGFLQKAGRNEYKPIEKEEYFRRILGDLLEKEGYRVLEHLK